jgi:hypothetical protein
MPVVSAVCVFLWMMQHTNKLIVVMLVVSAVCVFLWMMQYTNEVLLCLFQQSVCFYG